MIVVSVVGIALLLLVLVAALRSVLSLRPLVLKKVDEDSHHAYVIVAIAGALLLAFGVVDFKRIQTLEFWGWKTSLKEITQRLDTIEEFYRAEVVEEFGTDNWSQVKVSKTPGGYLLEVELKHAPIPASVRVLEGLLQIPRRLYKIDGNRLAFPSNIGEPSEIITVEYRPRLKPATAPTPFPK